MKYYHLPNKERSRRSEKAFAKVLGGRTNAASGALRVKGDVTAEFFLGEDKFTDKQSYSLKAATWEKVRREAFASSRKPLMRIDISGTVLYVMDEETLKELHAAKRTS